MRRDYSSWLMPVFIVLVILTVMKFVVPTFQITTGSMVPTIPVGASVITFKTGDYVVGDIITFHSDGGDVVTHRLIGFESNGDYITQGDDNESRDYWVEPVTKDDVIGEVIALIPFTALDAWLSLRGLGIAVCLMVVFLLCFWKIEDEEIYLGPVLALD